MKLQDWFHEQVEVQPSALQKMSIYQHFLDKSHRSIPYHRVSYYARVTLFSVGLLLIGGTAFYSFVPQTESPYQIVEKNDAYTTLQGGGQFAQADEIGEIFYVHGNIEILHNNTHIETNTLGENDRVRLAPGAEMHVRVDTDTELKVTGPAELFLEDRGVVNGIPNYVINLISGDYLEVNTVKVNEEEIVENPKITAHVIVQTPEFTLEKVDTRGALDVVISTNESNNTQVKNQGAEIVIKKIIEDKQTFVALQENEKVAINDTVEFVREDVDALLRDVEDNKLTVTYDLGVNDKEGDTINDVLVTSTIQRKQILDAEVMASLRTTINTTFLSHDISQMQEYYHVGDQSAFLIAYSNLLAKIQRAHILLDISYTPIAADITTLSVAAMTVNDLINNIDQKYYIEPGILDILRTVSQSLTTLANQTFGNEQQDNDLVNELTIVKNPEHEVAGPQEVPGDIIDEPSYEALLEGLDIE